MGKGSIKLLYWVLIGFFVLLCAKINSIGLIGYDGGSNPFTAFDELIFLREVYNILNASNLKEFVLSVIAGKGYIYGRFNYMCDALIAAIPFYVFGTKGLVFAIRMAHAFYLILGFHLINRYINKELGLSRLLSLIVFFFFPYTLYFIGMPKPEPMQLLLIGLFFTFNSKDWAWLLLGLAFGSKISIAFGCLFLVGVILYQFYQKEINLRQFLNKAFYGLTGLIIALPALPLSLISPHFRNGLIKIVTTASKPYDNPKITFGDWIIRLLQYYDPLPFWLSAILVLIILICAALILRKHREYSSYVIFAALAIIPIMLFTKRLWVFYLFIGMVMLIPFVFRFASEIARKKKRYWRFTPLFILLPFLISFKPAYLGMANAINRNQSETYKESKEATLDAIVYCNKHFPSKTIGIDLQLYYQFNWFLKPRHNIPSSVGKHNYKTSECIITPYKIDYPGKDSVYKLVHETVQVSIWLKN